MTMKEYIREISPPWLATGNAEKLLYSCAYVIDLLIEKCTQASKSHMPTKCDPSCLPYIGAERLIERGFLETNTAYGERLQAAFDAHRFAGMDRGVMRQVLGFLSPVSPLVEVVSQSSIWNVYADGDDLTIPALSNSAPTHVVPSPINWDWNGEGSFRWWRSWLIIAADGIASATSWVEPGPVYGTYAATGARWGDTTRSWGLSVPSTIISSIRRIVKQWKSQNTVFEWIVVSFDPTEFVATAPAGDPGLPDGEWVPFHKIVNGVAVPSRSANARYCEGVV
jgi:hypothetical protein